MKRSRLFVLLPLALVVASLIAASACRRTEATGSAEGTAALSSSAYDAETTDIARVLAGMRPLRGQAFASVTGLQEWRAWEAEAHERWGAARSDHVRPMRAWSDTELKSAASSCQTLLYPFGGTGLLAAYALFPSCEGYVLIGEEAVGQLPTLDAVTPSQVAGLAEDVRRALPDVFPPDATEGRRGPASQSGPRLTGAIPSLLVQLARLDARIVSAARFDITADGRPLDSIPIRGGNARPAALSLTFEAPNGRPQSLVYFPADLDDAAMKRRPGTWTFIRLQAPFITLLLPRPAAPAERFSLLRGLIRDQSRAILDAHPAWMPVASPDWAVSPLPILAAPVFSRPVSPLLATRTTTGVRSAK